MNSKYIYCYLGHHKCASTWFEAICQEACREMKMKFGLLYDATYFNKNLQTYITDNNIKFFAYANADYRYLEKMDNLKGFHVARDPRDIIISAYFSHLYSHPTHAWPELIEYRKKLESVDIDEGIHLEIDFREEQFNEMRSWKKSNNNNILHFKMEEITTAPYDQMMKIFKFLELVDESEFTASKRTSYFINKLARKIESAIKVPLPSTLKKIPAERLLGIIWENSFEKKSGGRSAGNENMKSHYRKGISGDWKNYFKEEHILHFKEKYNDVLIQYGYESDENWQ